MRNPQTGHDLPVYAGVHALGAYGIGSATLVNVAAPEAEVGDGVIYNSEMNVLDAPLGLGMKIQAPWVSAAGVISFVALNDGIGAQPVADRAYTLMLVPAQQTV